MVSDSLDAVGRGFKTLKIKVGGPPEKDIKRLTAIREAVGNVINLRLDANQAWTPQEAVRILQTIEDQGMGLDLAEQPVKGRDLEGLKYVADHMSVPIVADESAFSPRDVETIIRMRAADMINIKLMKTGGLYNAIKICTLAENAGMECMVGCMMESRISVTAAALLAGARSINTRIDLDPPLLCNEDPVEGGALYWNAYTCERRRNKPAAWQQWCRVPLKDKLDANMPALSDFKRTEQWKSGFMPEPARWLKSEPWLDEPTVSPPAGQATSDPWEVQRQ